MQEAWLWTDNRRLLVCNNHVGLCKIRRVAGSKIGVVVGGAVLAPRAHGAAGSNPLVDSAAGLNGVDGAAAQKVDGAAVLKRSHVRSGPSP